MQLETEQQETSSIESIKQERVRGRGREGWAYGRGMLGSFLHQKESPRGPIIGILG